MATSAPSAAPSAEAAPPPAPYDRAEAEHELLTILGDAAKAKEVLGMIDTLGAACPGFSRNFIATQAEHLLRANLPTGNNLSSLLSAMLDVSAVDGRTNRGVVLVSRSWILPSERGYAAAEDLDELARVGVSRPMLLEQISAQALRARSVTAAQLTTAVLTAVQKQYDRGGALGSACNASAPRDR